MTLRRCTGLASLLCALGLLDLACAPAVGDGQFSCDPLTPGSCPAGHACQRRPDQEGYRCWRSPGGYCGDGALDPGEACDGALIPESCRSLGYLGGRTGCTTACEIEVSGCLTATAVDCGPGHCCALGSDRGTYCWGAVVGLEPVEEAQPSFAPTRVPGADGFASVVVGNGFTCGLDPSGLAWCWGTNGYGELGCGHLGSPTAPVQVVGGPWMALAAGTGYACGLDLQGRAHCWGSNVIGQLGNGAPEGDVGSMVPVPVSGDHRFVELIVGTFMTCARTEAGEAYCWGLNDYGELGDGTLVSRSTPTPVVGDLSFTALGSGGMTHTCGIADDGRTYCWGFSFTLTPTAVPGEASLISLRLTYASACGLDAAGQAWCWGDGPVGNPQSFSEAMNRVPFDGVFVRLASTMSSLCGLTDAGRIFCWGWNGDGLLGRGAPRTGPTPVELGEPLASLAAGFAGSCGLTSAGKAWCWGSNQYGALADGTELYRYRPAAIGGVPPLSLIQVGGLGNFGLDQEDQIWGWGYLPQEPTLHGPEKQFPDRSWQSVAVGWAHVCALDLDGLAWCWGRNNHGQAGNGSTVDLIEPTAVARGIGFVNLALESDGTCGVDVTGKAWCWGRADLGQVGPVSALPVTEPLEIPFRFPDPLTVVTRALPGRRHSCALDSTGQAWCWGNGEYGALGDGTSRSRSDPGPVAQVGRFLDLVVGAVHSCGLDDEGSVWCWGYNGEGQLGDGTYATRFEPVRVSSDLTFTAIAAGEAHTCALDDSGVAHCWGNNGAGQLAADDYFVTPVEVDPPRDATP